jgi:large subunit ribosomal protein L18
LPAARKGEGDLFKKFDKAAQRRKRQLRGRQKIKGSGERPRLNVFRSLSNIYAQIINDETGATLVAASTIDRENKLGYGGNVEAAKKVGTLIAERALAKGISKVVFDRGGYVYHGRVAALAAAAREAGLDF